MTRILVADDHPFLRAGIEAVLRNSRYEIVGAVGGGTEALVAAAHFKPDLILLDVTMPPPDGIQVLEQLRKEGNRVPVVLLTAEIDDRQLLRAIRGEVNGIILKDGAEDGLLRCLDAVASGQKAIPPGLLERALTLSLQTDEGRLADLAPREREISKLVSLGLRNRDIADRLSMSEGTVKVYLHEIYRKLGVSNRTELAILALNEAS